ncbi:hypothetical protein N5T66_10260 [Aliarcobacter cryaerophilus]|uniref:hypothetical protein n=1 Tax=Aliarcobacter cryaerophilus TaxID=28198 RepID=UPI0021B4ADB2|nr:hypothetical protein [Aliarcobacter cryaerophilus]MCT7433670.1 hypothetical protein [Aliarcobacter cryaerophilus]
MANLAQIQSIAQGQFFVKDSLGNLTELKVGDTVSLNDTIVAASSNTDLSKIEILFDTNELITLSQGEQLLDTTLLASTFGNEELAFDKQEVDETLNAWNNTEAGDETDMETAAGDVTEQATNAGNEEAADGGALRSKFNSRDGDATDIVSDLREASWTGGIERTIEDSENMLLEQPLPIVYTIIEGIDVVNEGDSANYVVKLQDAAGNPVIATQDTIIYVRYTNKTTQDGDTQYNNENIIEVVIKAGTSQTEFTIKTNDDYLADNGEIYNVAITGNNSTEFDMRTGDVAGNKTNVDTTILDNSNPLNPGGEDGGYGSEDIVFAIIEGTTTVNEGDTAQYVVKLVDKDGNPVTVTKDTEVTIKYTNKTTQDGDTEYNNNDTIKITIKAGENSSDKFDVDTIDDYLADNGEKFNLEITNVDDQGQFEKVNIGDINGDKTNVDTTILDNTTDKPNENSTVESNQENVILKIVAADKDGNPIKDANGDYLTQNEVPEGNNAYYVVLAFEPNTTKFNDNTKLDIQSGTVEVQTFDKNATGTTTQTKEDGTQDYISKTQKVELGKVISVETLDDWKSDNNEQFEIKITDKSYQHPSTPVYENVVTNTDPVTTTIKDNTTPNTETNVEDVKIVLVAVSSATTTIADITNSDGTLKVTNTNETPEGGKLYYIAVAVDKDGKPLATQGGDVTINYGTTSTTSDKDATAGVDYDTTKLTTKVGVVFEVKTKDDYYAEGDENFTVKITDLKNSPYETPSIDTDNDTVTSTIKDNAPTINGTVVSGGEDTDGNTYGAEDTVYAIITGETTVNEGGEVTYTVKLVDKDGNTVIPTKETTVTVTYTNIGTTSTDDTNKTNNQEIAVKIDASGKGTFTVETKDDYYAEADENYNVKITNVQNTGEFENVKFDSYPNTIPNSPSNNVTTTIKDNPSKVEQPDTGTGNDDPINGSYGKEDTVYVKIEGNPTVVEGGKLSHTVTLVDKDGKAVTIPAGESVTVTLTYKEPANDKNPNADDYVTKTETITIKGGTSSTTFENITKVDFVTEGKEVYEITISKVEQSGAFENVAIDSTANKVTDTILDGITLGKPVDLKVDEDNFYQNDLNGTDGGNVTKSNLKASESLGITIPDGYEDIVGTYTINFAGNPTVDGVTKLTSDGKDIHFQTIGNKIIAYIGTDVGNGTVKPNNKVFEIVLNKSTGKYDYTQYKNIDHPKSGNVNEANGKENYNDNDNIDLNFKFNITTTSKNGQTVTSRPSQEFKVTVNDSTPIAGEKTLTIYEDNNGKNKGAYTFVLSDEGFNGDTIEISNDEGANYTSLSKNSSIEIKENGQIIGTLTNKGDGKLEFKPVEDYSKYTNDNLPNFKYKVSDTDGDYAEGTINIKVKPVADAPTIKFDTAKGAIVNSKFEVTTEEDNKNNNEGTHKVELGLKVPFLSKDQEDKNNASGDSPERNGEITLKFTNGNSLVSKAENKNIPNTGAKLFYTKDNGDITEIENFLINSNKNLKVVIVETSGLKDIDTKYHYNGLTPSAGTNEKVVYLTKSEYESLKIQHAEDNDTDIKITIKVTSYEVDDSGKPLFGHDTYTDKNNANLKSETTANMIVKIQAVTDDITLNWDSTKVNANIGTLDNNVLKFNTIKENNQDPKAGNIETNELNFGSLLTPTSGAGTDTKLDLDGSEKRSYTIKLEAEAGTTLPDYIYITIGNQKDIKVHKDANGNYKLDFSDTNNKLVNPEFKIKFPDYWSGDVTGTITLRTKDHGVDNDADKTDYTAVGGEADGVKKAEVKFEAKVTSIANIATIQVKQAIGYEDAGRGGDEKNQPKTGDILENGKNGIPLDIKVTSTDKDNSETFAIKISNIPNGGAIHYNGQLLTPENGKDYIEIPQFNNDLELKFIPPHNSHGDFDLTVNVKTIDGNDTRDYTDNPQTTIKVVVKDVADSVVGNDYNELDLVATPNTNDQVIGTHKQYNAIVSEDDNGGKISLDSIFKDSTKLASYDSASEDLTIIIRDLPIGVTLTGNVTLINGQYIFKADDISGINIVTPPNYSGELNFDIQYITTERGEFDPKEIASKTFDSNDDTKDPVSIFVKPTVDAVFNSKTEKAEDDFKNGVIVDKEKGLSYYKLDLGISHKNEDTDETLVSVTINEPTSSEYKLFIKNGDNFEAITFTNGKADIALEDLGKVYVQAPENKHGDFTLTGSFVAKDSKNGLGNSINYETTKEQDFTHKLTIKPVTDTPTITVDPDTDTSITVDAGKNTEIKIPLKVTSKDTDGSENITKIVISGVPQGVTVDGLTNGQVYDSNGNLVNVSVHNGIYTITGHDLNSSNFKDIIFNIGEDANFEYREITITAYTKDAEGSQERETSTVITLDKTHTGTGGGDSSKIGIELKDGDPYQATEDREFNFLDVFKVVVADGESDGRFTLNFSLDSTNATIKGLTQNSDGSYTITGNRADIESVLANLKVVPNKDYNDNHKTNKGTLDITVNIDGKTPITVNVPVTPVTDEAKVEIIPNDSTTINENGEFNFDIKLTNNSDKEFTNINDFYVVVNEYFEAGESSKGELYLGNTKLELVDGKYKLPADYKLGESLNLTYKSGEDRHGTVEIKVVAQNKETGATNELTSTGTTTITVKPVASSKIEAEKVQDGIEDKEMASVKLNVVKADPSEKFESVLIKVASGVAVYYNGGNSLAMNLGNDSWLVPVNSDGTLPQIFFKGKEHLGGEIDFTATINVKDDESKVTTTLTGSVYIEEDADGVTIDPTKTGIDKNAFEWTSLNLNANMKDLDGSEKMHFTLEGLDSSAQFRIVDKDGNITDLSSKASQDATGKWTIDGIEAKDINNIEISHDKSVSGAKVEAWTVDGDNVSTSPSVSGTFDLSYKADTKFDNGTFTLAKDMDIDFNNIGKLGFTNVEKIDLCAGNGKNELLNLTLQDVLDMGKKDGGNINLTILGDSQDKVSFADKSQWQKSETTIIENGKTFTQWSNTSDSTVTLKIEQPISDGITN